MDYRNHIEINPEIRFGKPCIIGTRIAVYDILAWLAEGLSVDQIISDFPSLTKENILATLAYSADKERKIQVSA